MISILATLYCASLKTIWSETLLIMPLGRSKQVEMQKQGIQWPTFTAKNCINGLYELGIK